MIYILKIDKICDKCGFRNIITEESQFPIEIIACGKCGNYLSAPDNMQLDDKTKVDDIINKELRNRKEHE